jgi:hypothetical protein
MNYIQQSEDFSKEDYLMLDQFRTILNEIREKQKVQANIFHGYIAGTQSINLVNLRKKT